ncbi:MAG: hypothetical protein ACI93V_000434 [Alteromonadaceae bacterium]|jgi:hypothetical protein|tara:strand:+ start:1520 stop:1867 length:348 start_codon:yes stop_codon:yes gene_type:complete
MSRDLTQFPEDNIGDALWKMQQAGDDLFRMRELEFSVLFPSELLALKFGQLLLENNQKISFCPFQNNDELPWEITAYPEFLPSYENIVAYQDLLVTSAMPLKGEFDGWYCMSSSK